MVEFNPNQCQSEMKKCIHLKMNKLKPATIVGIFSSLVVVIGLTTGGIYASYSNSVIKREENTKYMILAEAGKAREKLNEYCKKDTFHQADIRLEVLENNVGNIKEDVGELKDSVKELNQRSQKVLEIIKRLEGKVSGGGSR